VNLVPIHSNPATKPSLENEMKILFAVTVCLSALSGLLVTYQIQSVPQDQLSPFAPRK